MRYKRIFLTVLSALMVVTAGLASAGGPPIDPPGLEQAIAVQEAHTAALMAMEGVVGTAVGLTASGETAVKIFTEAAGITGLPRSLDGVAVDVIVTGKVTALAPPLCRGPPSLRPPECFDDTPTEEVDPTSQFELPVPIGVSSGPERLIMINGLLFCTGGTLSVRVKAGNNVYALSAAHVYALEGSTSDGAVQIGDNILQPGRIDLDGCGDAPFDDPSSGTTIIGTLEDFEPIEVDNTETCINPGDPDCNVIDAAIAATTTGDVGTDTPDDGYGTPKSATVAPVLDEAVQKYARTTGLTKGTIIGINAFVNIGYDTGTARFAKQIVVQGERGPFIKGGDSGGLLVTDPGRNPVGLLFAGTKSGKFAWANPINDVLSAFGVTIDGE